MSTKLKLMGVDVASIGDAHGSTPGSRAYQFTDERKQVYKKIVVSDCGKYLLGGVLVGDAGRVRHPAADDAEPASSCPRRPSS